MLEHFGFYAFFVLAFKTFVYAVNQLFISYLSGNVVNQKKNTCREKTNQCTEQYNYIPVESAEQLIFIIPPAILCTDKLDQDSI